ncbi:4-hydroxybenzoate octaprenyltransferase [Neptunomonas phycophila]|uniref:4-hydroxybenzoate octaprenyltransferase n=1 Tax=Neptunomonas phycophila TaxID=1572645 RepID=UPI001BE67EFF|nr:4-hydroxybenzoate octaprenyltransferase [Neptunomonas phycophila]MBT3145766.1 4-hydroxybenzoate octaprenyltransferase [Neptunomonas phycophila]MDO6784275.1 4-hydroxybenzoate octaprenyltransferase [Neptunomonas phycophila]
MSHVAPRPALTLRERLAIYTQLTRFNKPIGSYLLLWPTLWALWIAADGVPPLSLLIIFIAGVFITRSAGCVINDYADRHIDGHVKRTAERPLALGLISSKEALMLFAGLMLLAFVLVLFTNRMTIWMSFGALALASLYPFMKRHTHLPQVVLGAAFGWAIPMAFTAVDETLPLVAWLIFLAKLLWTVAYDTMYAMVDRDDDIKIGVKSTAILFGKQDKRIIGLLQIATLFVLLLVGTLESMTWPYYVGIVIAAVFFVYQQNLIKDRDRTRCFNAFLNNHYAELAVFVGIVVHFMTN